MANFLINKKSCILWYFLFHIFLSSSFHLSPLFHISSSFYHLFIIFFHLSFIFLSSFFHLSFIFLSSFFHLSFIFLSSFFHLSFIFLSEFNKIYYLDFRNSGTFVKVRNGRKLFR